MTATTHLRTCLTRIDRPLEFCATMVGEPILPGMRLDGLGMVALPLEEEQARSMENLGTLAGYGQGRDTVLDPAVRRVLRFAAEQVQFANPAWVDWLAEVVDQLAERMGLEKQGLVPHLHELLLYRPGDFFLPHRDGEKVPGMVATLSVQLPSRFEGGAIVVRHQGTEVQFTGDDPAHAFAPQAMAWYADCEHEILPLKRGHRLVLIYNLVLPADRAVLRAPDFTTEITNLRQGLQQWRTEQTAEDDLLVIPLHHAYSEDGLRPVWLKGADRAQADALFAAAARAGMEAHLALITYHVVGEPQGDFEHEDPEDMDLDLESLISEDLYAATWVDAAGTLVPLGRLALEREHFLDGYDTLTEEVTEQEFEGYTGNAGMELSRWYHRAAMILWPAERTGALLAAAGVQQALAVLEHRVRHGAGTSATALVDLAGAALERWIQDGRPGYGPRPEPGQVAGLLAEVGDAGLAKRYLGQVLAADPAEHPAAGLGPLLDRCGTQALVGALETGLTAACQASLERDAELVSCLAARLVARPDAACRRVAHAGAQTLVRLVLAEPATPLPQGVGVLAHLVGALADLGTDDLQRQLLTGLTPERADPATIQAEAIFAVRSRGPGPAAWIRPWTDRVINLLDQRFATAPKPPADHARPGLTVSDCADCRLLDAFLRDPRRPNEQFPLPESRRQHLLDVIRKQVCDVETSVLRRGRPYSLVCTKTTASFERALARHRHAVAQRARLAAEGS